MRRQVVGTIYGLLLVLEGNRKEWDVSTKLAIQDLRNARMLNIDPTEPERVNQYEFDKAFKERVEVEKQAAVREFAEKIKKRLDRSWDRSIDYNTVWDLGDAKEDVDKALSEYEEKL